MKKDEMLNAIENVANKFENSANVIYLGCTISIVRKYEPYKYITNNGKPATKSARYDGFITFPDGEIKVFKSWRGGAIARECGLYVRPEHDDMVKQGNLYEITNRRK